MAGNGSTPALEVACSVDGGHQGGTLHVHTVVRERVVVDTAYIVWVAFYEGAHALIVAHSPVDDAVAGYEAMIDECDDIGAAVDVGNRIELDRIAAEIEGLERAREHLIEDEMREDVAAVRARLPRVGVRVHGGVGLGRNGDCAPDVHAVAHECLSTTLQDAQGGCERIKNTAFPDRIAYFGHLVAWGLAIFIPFVVLDLGESADIVDVTLVPLMMLAFVLTERLGAELRNPFSNHSNDVPMRALCRTIEIDLRQQLGEKEVPVPLEPVKGVLM